MKKLLGINPQIYTFLFSPFFILACLVLKIFLDSKDYIDKNNKKMVEFKVHLPIQQSQAQQ
jgi:hypothetical protein